MIVLALAAIGILLNIIGRGLIVREDAALPRHMRLAVAFCPGAEIVYMIIRWERARIGAGLCAFSLALALPLLGHVAVIAQRPSNGTTSVGGLFEFIKSTLWQEAQLSRPEVRMLADERVINAKTEKVNDLRVHLMNWYNLLREREGYLCTDIPEDTEEFNRSAAAYHSLLAVSKIEAGELDRMQAGAGR